MSRRSSARRSPATDSSVTQLVSLGTTRSSQQDSIQQEESAPLCRFFVLHKGNCRYGSECAYSHQLPEGLSFEQAKGLVPCPFYARGDCRYGEYCQLQHETLVEEPSSLKPSGGASSSGVREEAVSSAMASLPSTPALYCQDVAGEPTCPSTAKDEFEEEEEEEVITCGICLEDDPQRRRYGLLSCCNHAFCFDCLMEWRKEGTAEASDRRSCPTCRKHSDYVIPSTHFPRSEAAKQAIVQTYKQKKARIPCRRFEMTKKLGSCPFGSDCFYAHIDADGRNLKAQDQSREEITAERQRRRVERSRRHWERLEGDEADLEIDTADALISFLHLLDVYGYPGIREHYFSDDEDHDDDDEEYLDEEGYSHNDEVAASTDDYARHVRRAFLEHQDINFAVLAHLLDSSQEDFGDDPNMPYVD